MMNEGTPLSKRIEAMLFVHGDPMSIVRLTEITGENKTAVLAALTELDARLVRSALAVVYHKDEVQLVLRGYLKSDIDRLVDNEHARGLTRAAAETLAVIAYQGPITKKEIDFIRGVNSAFALRSLAIRGLVAKRASRTKYRVSIYEPTLDFLKFAGVQRAEELPQYAEFRQKMQTFIKSEETTPDA